MSAYLENAFEQCVTARGRIAEFCRGVHNVRRGGGGLDLLYCICRYGVTSRQYLENADIMHSDGRLDLLRRMGAENRFKNKWTKEREANWRFLAKWGKMTYMGSVHAYRKRLNAYKRHYHLESSQRLRIGYNVVLFKEHFSEESIAVGDDVMFGYGAFVDYTGGLVIKDHVRLMESVKIATHGHDYFGLRTKKALMPYNDNRAYKTPLIIGENVKICARAIINPGVREIGANSIISAGAIVKRRVPPNSLVAVDGTIQSLPGWK